MYTRKDFACREAHSRIGLPYFEGMGSSMNGSLYTIGSINICLFIASICLITASGCLYAAPTNNSNGANATDVGIWYCTYYGEDWNRVGGMGYTPTMYRPLCSDRSGDYRIYDASDVSVIDFHLRQIANAKIDFILFELTPGGLGGYRPAMNIFVDNARIVAKRIKEWNSTHARKIQYAIAAGSHPDVYGSDPIAQCMEREAEDVYKSFYENAEYGGADNYYHLNGKPLLVYWGDIDGNTAAWTNYVGDRTYGDKFSIRYASDVRSGSYGWNIYSTGTVVNSEVEVVSPGWGHYTRTNPPYVSRRLGDFYRNCWHTVLTNPRPQIVMIVAFNDYLENTGVWTADTSSLTDADKWYGHDEKLHPWMYWDITVGNINALRGAACYKIFNDGTGKVLDALDRHCGDELYAWDDADMPSQRWQLIDIGDGLFEIVNSYSGQALGFKQTDNERRPRIYTYTGGKSQQWRIIDIGNGFSKIADASTGLILDCGTKNDCEHITVSPDKGYASQRWRIEKANAYSQFYGNGQP